ncbi:MAG: glycosyltransferase [Calditrichaeota bacterium]|nr:MAG: glycosyltransferase [Calditrichota bacterium]
MNGKIKVLFITDTLDCGGKERQLVELLKGFSREEFEYHIITMKKDAFFNEEAKKFASSFHVIEREWRWDFAILRRFAKVFKEIKPDFIHGFNPMASLVALVATKLFRVKTLVINGGLRSAPIQFSENIKFFKKFLRFYKIVVSNSYAGLKAYGEENKKGRFVLYNGFDFSRVPKKSQNQAREELGFPKGKFIIPMIAQVSNRKDQRTFIRAAETLKKQNKLNDFLFLVVGEGDKRKELEQITIDKGLQDNVKFLGNRRDVEMILRASDISVLCTAPWWGEGISNSILESFACGVPVIATDNGGTKEVIENGKSGFIIEIGNHDELVDKILFLKDNKDILQNFSKEAVKTVEEKFSISKMVSNYAEFYKNVVAKF